MAPPLKVVSVSRQTYASYKDGRRGAPGHQCARKALLRALIANAVPAGVGTERTASPDRHVDRCRLARHFIPRRRRDRARRTDVFEIGETHRRLAYWLDEYHAQNEPKIDRLFTFYRLATVALLGEVIFWSLQLALS